MSPLVSVVLRSYQRPVELMDLLARLRRQTHRPFEVVVVEQTGDPELHRRIEALADERIRLVTRPPLGAPGARNEALRHARGEILAFIDDDDVPLADDWIARHVENYADPLCLGVDGRIVDGPGESPPPRLPGRTYRLCATHTFWRDTRGFLGGTRRKLGVDYLNGTNSSVRRALVDRIGGWDEGVAAWGEEQSFAFKFARDRRPGEHFVFDPRPEVWRRTDVPGGANRRVGGDWHSRELRGRIRYYHAVVGHYFPWRFRLLYPLYAIRALGQMVGWIWDGDNRWHGTGVRLRASVDVAVRFPWLWLQAGRETGEGVRRITSLRELA